MPFHRQEQQALSDVAVFREKLLALCATRFSSAPTIVRYRKAHAYMCGGRDRNVYIIESGQVKTLATAANGKRCLLSIFAAGDVFGETGLLGHERIETAVALKRTVLRQVSADRFLSVLSAHNMLQEFVKHLSERMLKQQNIIVDMVTMESERRLAARLLYLAQHLGTRNGDGLRIDARITHEELAEMVGTTRSRVGYFLKRFRDAGLVEVNGRVLVIHERHLAAFIENRPSFPMLNCG